MHHLQQYSSGGPLGPPIPRPRQKGPRATTRRFVAFEFARPPPTEPCLPADETEGLAAFLFDLLSKDAAGGVEACRPINSGAPHHIPAATAPTATTAAAAPAGGDSTMPLPWGPPGHVVQTSSATQNTPWGPWGAPQPRESPATSPEALEQMRRQQQQQQPQQQPWQQQHQQQQPQQGDTSPGSLPVAEQVQRLRRLAKARGPRGAPKDLGRPSRHQSDIRAYLVPSRGPLQQQREQHEEQQGPLEEEDEWPDLPLAEGRSQDEQAAGGAPLRVSESADVEATAEATRAHWGPRTSFTGAGPFDPGREADEDPPQGAPVEAPLGAPVDSRSPAGFDVSCGHKEASALQQQGSSSISNGGPPLETPGASSPVSYYANSCGGPAVGGSLQTPHNQEVLSLSSCPSEASASFPEIYAEASHERTLGEGPRLEDSPGEPAEGGPPKKRGAAKAKQTPMKKKGPRGPRGPLIFDPVAAWEALYDKWKHKLGLGFGFLFRVLVEQEGPVALLLSLLETTGIACDESVLRPHKARLQEELQRVAAACCSAAGVSFIPSSHKQVAYVLYRHLKLGPPLGAPPGGGPSRVSPGGGRTRQLCTDDNGLQDAHPVVPLLQSYRQIAKLLTTFLEPLTPLFPPDDTEGAPQGKEEAPGGAVGFRVPPGPPEAPSSKVGGFTTPWAGGSRGARQPQFRRVYCRWNQTKTVTGRLSTSYYNMQTVPREALVLLPFKEGPLFQPPQQGGPPQAEGPQGGPVASGGPLREVSLRCRDAFVPTDPKRQVFVSADFAQIEMRVLAHFCAGGRLAKLLEKRGGDPYREMAATFAQIPYEDVSPDLRTKAKTVCLSLLYGGGTHTVSRQLNISFQEAVQCRQRFADAFPEIPIFVRNTKAFAANHRFVTTITGRRRPVDLGCTDPAMMLRQAVNSRIQGSASDLIKQAMLAVQRALQTRQANP
ncbi:hypothetical protein Esti_000864 [Eimeria stiedai]